MFETLVTGLLTGALGNYIDPKCFSSDKINVEVWSGYVVLHALEIKPDVIVHPAMTLVRGVIGSIELKIPWNRLNSDSVVVTIDDVYLLVRTEADMERTVLELNEATLKKQLLEELYAQAKKQQDAVAADDAQAANADSGFAVRLINKIIDNLELHIRRIHVRLEDHNTGDHPFAVGLTIESVHIQSTNASWQPSYVDTSKTHEPRIYKIVELNHLSVYLNPHCDVLRHAEHAHVDFATCSLDVFTSCFSRSIPKRFDDRRATYNSHHHHQQQTQQHHTQLYPAHEQHHFLVKPVDAQARLVVNRDPFDASGGPKFDLAVSIPEVALRLEDSQYCDLLYLAAAFQAPQHVAKYAPYKRLRPRSAVLDAAPGEWWQYAIAAVLHDVRAKRQCWSWTYMKQRRDDRKKYVAAWERETRRVRDGRERSYLDSESEEEDDGDDDYNDGDDGAQQRTSTDSERNANGKDDHDDDPTSLFSPISHVSSASSSKSGTTVSVLDEIERRRSVEDILFFRYLADRRVRESASATLTKHRTDDDNDDAPRSMPLPASVVFSDTDSVDTELSESTLPTEVKFRSWGSWMFGWTSKLASPSPSSSAAPSGRPDKVPRRVLPEVELRELFKILEYEPSKRSKKLRKQQKQQHKQNGGADTNDSDATNAEDLELECDDFRVTVTLNKASLTLSSDADATTKLQRDDPSFSTKYAPTDFLLGTFAHLQLAAVARGDAIKVDVSLQAIEAFDESSESSSFSRLLSRKQSSVLGGNAGGGVNGNSGSGVNGTSVAAELEHSAFGGPVFLLSYETNPVMSSADAALYIHLEPLEVVFSPTATCWGRLSRFLNTPDVLGLWAELEVASFNDIVNLKARTEAKLEYAMANRIAVSVDLRIQAPVLIIPESDTDIHCARLVVDLGHINFRTDRLSKLDGDSLRHTMSSSSASMSGGGASSLTLRNPMSSPSLSSSTSFVKQLYDDAEKGEGAIRWKEEFYDKFSLSVTNVHVFLVPYGKHRQSAAASAARGASSNGAGSRSSASPSRATHYDEHEYELVERFNINVTVRMSVLPLDATLTRFYVHADLPALTFKMSLEKYCQLAYLVERFSVASASATAAAADDDGNLFASSSGLFDSTTLFDSLDASSPFDYDDRGAVRRKNSFLSASMLQRIVNDDEQDKTTLAAAPPLHLDDASDSESSTGSDDTWFSITSGTVDLNLLSPLERSASSSGSTSAAASSSRTENFARPAPSQAAVPPLPQARREARAADRPYAANATTQSELLDRRLVVCTFTFPLISVQLKKPSSVGVPASASYRYDGSDFEDDVADNGTVLVKLQGFRVRVAKKTLSTQANCSFRSLEVEDYLDASGKSSEFLLFSCPTIVAPFSMRAPQRRTNAGKAFAPSMLSRRRASRQRERVISFQRYGNTAAATAANAPLLAPENLLEFVLSSTNDSVTGHETLREIDIRVGCLQFNFDQAYICSLLELLDETSSKLTTTPPAPVPDLALTATATTTLPADDDFLLPPPLQLTPSVSQEYSLPMSLTASVRADLESARKRLLATQTSAAKAKRDTSTPPPVQLKVTLRAQSLSVCFCDRGEPEASVAILRVLVQLHSSDDGDMLVKGTVGDIKVFDLSPKKHQYATGESESDAQFAVGGTGATNKRESGQRAFTDIFGLDMNALTTRAGDSSSPQFIVGIDCRIVPQRSQEASDDGTQTRALPPRQSSVSISIQPIQLLVQPDFVENVTSYVLDGPLRAYLLVRHDPVTFPPPQHVDTFARHPRSTSFGFDDLYARHPRSQSFLLENASMHSASHSPFVDAMSFASPHDRARLTPFFDAVDASSRRVERGLSPEVSTFVVPPPLHDANKHETLFASPHADDSSPNDTMAVDATVAAATDDPTPLQRSVFDTFDIELKLISLSVVLPSMTTDGHTSAASGLRIRIGTVAGSIVNAAASDNNEDDSDSDSNDQHTQITCRAKETHLAVGDIEATSVHDNVNLLEKVELRMRCDVPTQRRAVVCHNNNRENDADNGVDAANTAAAATGERDLLDVSVIVSPVCINVSEKTASLGLDVFYGTIKPILDIATAATLRRDTLDNDSLLGSVAINDTNDGDIPLDDAMQTTNDTHSSARRRHDGVLGLKASVTVAAVKIALQSHAESPQVFESWLKNLFDASDDAPHVRDAQHGGLGSPRRQRPDAWSRRSSLPKAHGATTVAELVVTGLAMKATADALDIVTLRESPSSSARLKLSLQKAVIRDMIADPEECITHLFEPVHRLYRSPRAAHRDDRTPRRSLSATNRRHSSSFGLQLDDHRASFHTRSSLVEEDEDEDIAPQLRVVVVMHPTPQNGKRRSDNAMSVTLASARLNVLPRTLLRLEHFGVETFVAVRRRAYQLEAQYKPRMVAPPPASSARTHHAYKESLRGDYGDSDDFALMQRAHTLSDRYLEASTTRPGRKLSMSDSVRNGNDNKRAAAFQSPMTSSRSMHGNNDDDDRPSYIKLSTSDLATPDAVAAVDESDNVKFIDERSEHVETDPAVAISSSADANNDDGASNNVATGSLRRANDDTCAWIVHVELANLQLWLLSSDKKADAAGVKLSASVTADVTTFHVNAGDDDANARVRCRSDFVVATATIGGIELSIGAPIDERTDSGTRSAKSVVHYPWTLIEPFSVHADVTSSVFRRPQLQQSAAASPGDAELVRVVSFDARSTSLDNDADATNVLLDDALLLRLPSDWNDWVQHVPSVQVDAIASRVSYRNLPVLLKIAATLSSVATAEAKVRQTLTTRLEALGDEFGWDDFSDDDHEHHADSAAFGSFEELPRTTSASAAALAARNDHNRVVTRATLEVAGVQFRVINNIVDHESPVIGVNIGRVSVSHFANASTRELELSLATAIDAWYHNLRLVTSEPLIEPWRVELLVSRNPIARNIESDAAVAAAIEPDHALLDAMPPLEVKIVSRETLQLNLTEAFIANLMAANRAWQWVVNAGGDPREMTAYSTYWIRNTTGLHLHYWGSACKASTLAPGGEEPLEFVDENSSSDDDDNERSTGRTTRSDRSVQMHSRQIFVAVFEQNEKHNEARNNLIDKTATTTTTPLHVERKWQSETAIPVDQVDSRMYALVNATADGFASKRRKCECVIDVLVERGCKVFVVRSTLLLENNSGSDLEVEFVPPPATYVSPTSRGDDVAPIWRAVVKAATVVPVPLHLVALGGGHIVTRPPGIESIDAHGNTQRKLYAKERVRLPLFDRDTSSATTNSDELSDVSSTMKFHRLLSDRPVRPFVLRACLSNSRSGLYHRTLSFYPPLVLHNLTAGPLEYCLSTPNDWVPETEQRLATSTPHQQQQRYEDAQQRLRERGTINVADRVIWHVSDWDTPLELSVRMKGFDWSEPIALRNDGIAAARIKMKDVVTDAFLYITAESEEHVGVSQCREIFLYVPYWIVNLTGLALEYEFDDDRTGSEHHTTLLAGQKRLDRDELLLKENQRTTLVPRERNAHVLHTTFASGSISSATGGGRRLEATTERRSRDHKRRHPCLLPSVPPIKGLLDLLPKSIDDPKALGQLDVLQVCHSDYRSERGCVRLRVTDDERSGGSPTDSVAKENAQQRKWSDVLVLDQTGTSGEIETADYSTSRNYSIGYSIRAATGRYSRTKVVMLTPRFMLVNTLSCAIEVCHSSAKFSTTTTSAIDIASSVHLPNNGMMSSMNSVVHLDAGAYADFHWTLRFGKTRAIRCRLAEYGWSWSGAVPLGESGEFAVRMRHETTRESKLLRLTLKLDGACVCVYFREESASAPPYRIENYSLETLRIHQYRVRRSEILLPHHSLDYAWDEPTQERLLVVDMLPSAAGDNSRPLRIGTFALDKIQRHPDALSGTLGIEVSTDGPTRVLRFTDARLRGDRNSTIVALDAATARTSSKALVRGDDVLRRFVTAPSLQLVLQLHGIGVSVVDSVPKELVYATVAGIYVQMLVSDDGRQRETERAFVGGGGDTAVSRLERESSPRILACRFEIGDLQIDNQLQSTPFPVLLRFSNSAVRSQRISGVVGTVPALQLVLVKHDEYAGINFIRFFSARARPVHIRVDGALLSHLAPLVVHSNAYSAVDHHHHHATGKSNTGNSSSASSQQRLLLNDYHASLDVNVRILAAIREDEAATSVAPSSRSIHTNKSRSDGVANTSNNGRGKSASNGSVVHGDRPAFAASGPFYPTTTQSKFTSKDEDKKLYFEEFYIDPIRATVSFSFGSSVSAFADSSSPFADTSIRESTAGATTSIPVGPLRLILNAIGMSLTKIANAPFELNAVVISHAFMQPDALATRLVSHYQSEALRQAYVILGSVDVLGNPMIAWKNLRAGVQDFIYEPAYGIAESPAAFALGVGRGSRSLLRASVYTALDFHARILTATALGLSEACLKLDDYTGYPATRNIYQGLAQGISGLVVAPIHAVEVNGVLRGVVPGLVAGVFGLVLKPLLGVALAAATTTATLRDAVEPHTNKALLLRVRPPRFIDVRTRRLKVYSFVESLGEELVSRLSGGRFRADGYVGHVDLLTSHQCLLVTRKRILLLVARKRTGIGGSTGSFSSGSAAGSGRALQYDVEWELLADEVILVESKRRDKDNVTLYYIRNGVQSRDRTPSIGTITPLHNMQLRKYVVALPESKLLFVRAMLQQMERSVVTKMNCKSDSDGALPGENHWPSTLDRSPWPSPTPPPHTSAATYHNQQQQQRSGNEYPLFRIPAALTPTRSFVSNVATMQQMPSTQ